MLNEERLVCHGTMKRQPDKDQSESTKSGNSGDENSTEIISELSDACWSVISFDRVESHGLAYEDAVELLQKLEQNGISGLCIVTDEAAENVSPA
jgi:hypothetical protein